MRRRAATRRNRVRIIGGTEGGRRLVFPCGKGLRPTPDRVRETLFNWLQQVVPGSRCLDLYAGSGALGVEALSRGAAAVVLVEIDRRAASVLRDNVAELGFANATVHNGDAMDWLARRDQAKSRCFDLVFLDPPFKGRDVHRICRQLERHEVLASQALIYVESGKALDGSGLPPVWVMRKNGKAGAVYFYLFQRRGDSPGSREE